jgi:hypothetical protein
MITVRHPKDKLAICRQRAVILNNEKSVIRWKAIEEIKNSRSKAVVKRGSKCAGATKINQSEPAVIRP